MIDTPSVVRPSAPTPAHLSDIQILRGVAALMVLIYHVGNEFGDRGFPVDLPWLGIGSAGVDVFFVISGFIMVHSSAESFGRRGASGLFLARRAIRLVPLYWIVTTVFVAVAMFDAGTIRLPRDTARWIAASYAFLFRPHGDGGDFPLYAQGWTLNFEMFFYLCFAAVLPMRRPAALGTLALGFALLTAIGLWRPLPWPATRWTDTNIVEFILGIGLAEVHRRGTRIPRSAALALAAAGFAVFAVTIDSVDAWLPYRGFVWGPPALAIVAAAALGRPGRQGAIRRGWESLGDASYALYLVHYAFFVALAAGLGRFVDVATVPPAVYAALCIGGAVALGYATHLWIEAPLTRGLNRAFGLSDRWRRLTAGRNAAGES